MKNKVVIVGHSDTTHITTIMAQKGLKDSEVLIVTPDEAKQLPFPKSEPTIIKKYYEGLYDIDNAKKFTCKGKHQYREVNSIWVCECGRKL